jgi:hypothetical protein
MLFDLSGKLVYMDELRNTGTRLDHELDLSVFEKGLYHLYLKTPGGIYNKTIVIQ